MLAIQIDSRRPYGPLSADFHFVLSDGYTVLVGPNNVGKSAILQLSFTRALESLGPQQLVMIPAERAYLAATTEVAGQTLEAFNNNLNPQIVSNMLANESMTAANARMLSALLLNHSDFLRQVERL